VNDFTTNTIGSDRRRGQRIALIVGALAAVGCVLGAVFDWEQFLRAYLYAYLFVLGLSLGGLTLLMVHNLAGGAWGLLIRRLAEAQVRLLPLAAVLSLPLIVGMNRLFPWYREESSGPAAEFGLTWRQYLEPSFFSLRATAYFVVWIALSLATGVWSRGRYESPNAGRVWWTHKVSGFGLVLLGVTVHFAAIDWIMSLQPGFTSTILGPLVLTSQVLSSYALSVLLFCSLADRPEYDRVFSSKVMNDLGSLLLTILILWAYLAWFQFMLIWMADLPRGNIWYLIRWRGAWGYAGAVLACFQFVLPFFALLFRVVKQSRRRLAAVAGLVFAGQWVFMYYQIMPLAPQVGWARHWIDLLTPLALGGIWLAAVLWLIEHRPLLPASDLNYEQAQLLREMDVEEAAREEALAHE
jgi:hypothetical protein